MQVDEEEKVLMSAEDLFNQIVTLTGGRSAEELIFHTKTTGASNDIERATKIARSMVTRFGMTEDFDFIALETVQNQYLGGDAQLTASQGTAKSIDDAVRQIITKAHQTALDLLREYEQQLHDIAQFLLQKETITGEEFMDVLERSLAFYGKKMPEKEVLKEEIAGEMPAALEPALEPSSEEGAQEKEGELTSSPGSSTDVPVQPLVEDSLAEGQEALEEEQTSVSSDVSEDKREN